MNTKVGKVYDCAVIGGGVVGTLTARALTEYAGDFILIEAGNDVAVGTTKANSGIVHAGYDAKPNTLKAKFNVRGNAMMEGVCRELEVPFKRNGALVLEFDGDEKVKRLYERGKENGAETQVITGDRARALEPKLSDKVTAALYSPTSGIVSPYELAIAASENFIANGGTLVKNSPVTDIKRCDGAYVITAGDAIYRARTVVNAAGLYSDKIHNAVCSDKLEIHARRGQYMLLDKAAKPVELTVFQTPTELGKGVLVAPTCHGNTLVGPSAEDIDDKANVATTYDGLDGTFECAKLSVPSIARRDIITQFAGNRALCGEDFIIGENEDGFFDAVGICSPGLASSPAIAKHIAKCVAEKIKAEINKNYDGRRAAIPCFAQADDATRDRLIKENPLYGRIVCRCENVTEAEIVEAVRRGAVDADGVKRRVRAGMGRCQGGFCTPNLIKIIARELNVPPVLVTKRGGGSGICW